MHWAPLLIAALLGGAAAAFHAHHKLPRFASVLGGFFVVFLIAGVSFLLRLVGHPLAPGPMMITAVVVGAVSLGFVWMDIVKGHHAKPLFGKAGKAHHFRPQYATAALAIAALVIAANFTAIWHGFGSGVSQTWSSITGPGR